MIFHYWVDSFAMTTTQTLTFVSSDFYATQTLDLTWSETEVMGDSGKPQVVDRRICDFAQDWRAGFGNRGAQVSGQRARTRLEAVQPIRVGVVRRSKGWLGRKIGRQRGWTGTNLRARFMPHRR